MDPNDSDKPSATSNTTQMDGRDFNLLGMTQIIITAATPVVEDGTDKSFPPIGEREERNKDDSTESDNQKDERPSSSSTGRKSMAGENKQTEKSKIIEGRQQAKEAQIVTRTINSPKPNPEDSPSSDQDSSEVQPLEEAEDPFKENSNPANAETSAGFEANFEANFDDAFASSEAKQDDVDAGAPKQVVGGRASIPEELDSNQLERLQNLKESNA